MAGFACDRCGTSVSGYDYRRRGGDVVCLDCLEEVDDEH